SGGDDRVNHALVVFGVDGDQIDERAVTFDMGHYCRDRVAARRSQGTGERSRQGYRRGVQVDTGRAPTADGRVRFDDAGRYVGANRRDDVFGASTQCGDVAAQRLLDRRLRPGDGRLKSGKRELVDA